jgi:hypothetical protein
MADLDLDKYYDLIDDNANVVGLRVHNTGFDCELVDESGKRYDGFILAKSPKEQAYTVCDVSFHYSATAKKQPQTQQLAGETQEKPTSRLQAVLPDEV